jgi:hypothetical protein
MMIYARKKNRHIGLSARITSSKIAANRCTGIVAQQVIQANQRLWPMNIST